MTFPMPLVVAPRRAVTLGGERFERETLKVEMATQSLADVRAMLRGITREQGTQQTALGNPPVLLEVDGSTSRPVEAVEKKTVVVFGVTLAASAMRQVEMELTQAIAQATTPRTGRLGDVSSSWQWLFVRKGQAAQPVSSGSPPKAFAPGDALVLAPRDVPYATITNRNVARSGRIKPRAGRKGVVAKSKQNRGFLFWAAERVRKRPAFTQFHVTVLFSKAHMVPGELMTRVQGSGMLVIRARLRARLI
jgi:hypothetical protein